MADLELPRIVYRPTDVVRIDHPGFDVLRVNTAAELDGALSAGWTLTADAASAPEQPSSEDAPVKPKARKKGAA